MQIAVFMKKLMSDPRFHLGTGLAGAAGMVASSFLFVQGCKEIKTGFKYKDKHVVLIGFLKTIPMIMSTITTGFSMISSYRSYRGLSSTASDTISRLSALATPAAGIVADTTIDKITDEIADAVHEEAPKEEPKKEEVDVNKGNNIEIVDTLSGQHFFSSINKVEEAVNAFNNKLLDGDFRSVNDFYYYLGLNDILLGEDLGWQLDSNNNGMLVVRFVGDIQNGKPVAKMVYRVAPKAARKC